MEGTVYSLLPPLVAIGICVWLRQALAALFLGVLVGSVLINHFAPIASIVYTFDHIFYNTITDRDHIVNLMFTTCIGGLVGILNFSPASTVLLEKLSERLKTRRRTSMVIWFSGFIFFIDDYANSLIIGNAYRKVVDRFRISREKLAYLVDTTSAPIASLALVSTWIGFEISVISGALNASHVTDYTGFGLFLTSIPYRFYPLLAIWLCLLVCWTQRDFGSMFSVEWNAIHDEFKPRTAEEMDASKREAPAISRPESILIPLIVLVGCAIAFLGIHGLMSAEGVDWGHPLVAAIDVLSAADPFMTLLLATWTATVVSFFVHIMTAKESFGFVFGNWLKGCRNMLYIDLILILAWCIGDVCKILDTGGFVAGLLEHGFNEHYLPLLTFLFAAAISFATGTSYGTMSILMPIVVPIVVALGIENPEIMLGTVGSVLGGAIFGDHCSPLSDTTILSAGASGCDLTAHVNTQLPYALAVAAVSTICLLLVPLEAFSSYSLLLMGSALLVLAIYVFGKNPAGGHEVTAEDAKPVERPVEEE